MNLGGIIFQQMSESVEKKFRENINRLKNYY